jgi:ubiquinone/menaquinone biosynthesis C-methylase UbiE
MTQNTSNTSYRFGHSEEEIRRLVRQAQLYNPSTQRFLEQAGITAGMKVLDVGSGAGDVALLLAGRVGPSGRVIGVDVGPAIVDLARARAQATGLENVSFLVGDINSIELDDDFDAIVGRFVLIHLPEPAATLHSLVQHLRPGGIVAFQDSDTTAAVCIPPSQLTERVESWVKEAIRRAGLEMHMGLQLYHLLLEAGLPAPYMSSEAVVAGSRESNQAEMELVIEYTVMAVQTFLPLILKFGIATAEEVALDTLAQRFREEVTKQRMVVRIGMDIISAWTRKVLGGQRIS